MEGSWKKMRHGFQLKPVVNSLWNEDTKYLALWERLNQDPPFRLERTWRGLGKKLVGQVGAPVGGGCGLLPSGVPGAQFQQCRPRTPGHGGQSPDPALPQDRWRWGGHRTAGMFLPPGAPKLCQRPRPPRAPRPVQTGS